MTCPQCAAVMPDDDLFCEECGQPLKDPPRNPDAPLCLCGAPEGDLDEDGYCLQCGRRCRPAPGDHQEFELSLVFAAVTDRGRHHHRNEDRCFIGAHPWREERTELASPSDDTPDPEPVVRGLNSGDSSDEAKLLIVCDGVSSSSEAQTASQAAADALSQAIASGDDLATALQRAAQAVAGLGEAGGQSAPSTTVVAATVHGRAIHVGWLGDSRAYWIAGEASQQLTTDHSWLNDIVASGAVTYEVAVQSPRSHAITRWLGADAGSTVEASFTHFEAPGPGYLLLCSDGLWNYADRLDRLAELVLAQPEESALETARRLVSFANEQGGHDNISAALLRFID